HRGGCRVTGSVGDVLSMIRDNEVQIVDLRFADLPGLMQHFSVPTSELTEESFEEGFGFDGSAIRGFRGVQGSDMLLFPDPAPAVLDPFATHPTLVINCFVGDPVTGEAYSRDPRNIARKAEAHLQGTGIADTSYFGPECEFYIFDSVRFDQNQHSAYYFVDAVEGQWNSGADEGGRNLGYKPRYKEGYFPVPPTDHYQDLRSEMVLTLIRCGIDVEVHHHEVGTAAHGRQGDAVQVRGQERGQALRQDGHLHAQADLRGQRLGHAHPPEPLVRRRAAGLRRGGLRRAT